MSKILLVEDDAELLKLTAYMMRRERYVVIEANDGLQAIGRWKAVMPDLVILDLGLPGLDGFEVIKRIRASDDTPILVLSARRGALDVLRAFDLGTDDYLAKPFEVSELIARARAILRRCRRPVETQPEPRLELDGLSLDPASYEVTWAAGCVRLTRTEFRIFYLLGANAGHVVPTTRLCERVWQRDEGATNALRSHISHLRHKLEVSGEIAGSIVSAPCVGYVYRRRASVVRPPSHVPDSWLRHTNGQSTDSVA